MRQLMIGRGLMCALVVWALMSFQVLSAASSEPATTRAPASAPAPFPQVQGQSGSGQQLLGPFDAQAFCRSLGPNWQPGSIYSGKLTCNQTISGNSGGQQQGTFHFQETPVDQVCQKVYNEPNAYARQTGSNSKDPNSWACYVDRTPVTQAPQAPPPAPTSPTTSPNPVTPGGVTVNPSIPTAPTPPPTPTSSVLQPTASSPALPQTPPSLPPISVPSPATPPAPSSEPPLQIAILLAGYLTDTRDSDSTIGFSKIISHVLELNGYSDASQIIHYSYAYPNLDYDKEDTYVALPNRGVNALRQQISDIVQTHQNARITLIGHSLGGEVAWEHLKSATPDQLRHIDRLITLDSPVNGFQIEDLTYLGLLAPEAQMFARALASSQSGDYLKQLASDGSLMTTNATLAHDILVNYHIVVKTISNRQDELIHTYRATIPACDTILDLGTQDQFLLGHGNVLTDEKAMYAIYDALKAPR